jgi:ABC-type transport system substrate-binding protein
VAGLGCVVGIDAAARPRYGGTIRLDTAASLAAITSAAAADPAEAAARDRIRALVFETLVTPGSDGAIRGVLATTWDADARGTRWRFTMRRGVRLHDGSLVTAQDIAAALAGSAAPWKVTADADAVVIDADRPMPELLWELADPRYAVAVTRGSATLGTGAFAIDRVEAGRVLVLRAHEEHWEGRPFLDAVRVETGRRVADQAADLDLGRADIVRVGPQDARRLRQRGLGIAASRPLELIALLRQPEGGRAVDERARQALSLAIDRRAMTDVLLQRLGEPAGTVFPPWLTGYGALFPLAYDRERARRLVAALPADRRTLTVRFETADALARTLAERVVADARETGLTVILDPSQPPSLRPIDFRIVRMPFDTTAADRAVARVRAAVHAQVQQALFVAPEAGAPLDAVLRFERNLLDRHVVVPLVHVPEVYAIAGGVESATGAFVLPSFALDLANVWRRSGAP